VGYLIATIDPPSAAVTVEVVPVTDSAGEAMVLVKAGAEGSATVSGSVTCGSAAGTAAVLYAFFPLAVVNSVMFVLIAHEMGHFLVARDRGYDPDWPLFVPVFVLAFGLTHIPGVATEDVPAIANAGSYFGIAAAVLVMLGAITLHSYLLLVTGFWLVIWQVIDHFIGPDAALKTSRTDEQTFYRRVFGGIDAVPSR
jgi:hypothetical protein